MSQPPPDRGPYGPGPRREPPEVIRRAPGHHPPNAIPRPPQQRPQQPRQSGPPLRPTRELPRYQPPPAPPAQPRRLPTPPAAPAQRRPVAQPPAPAPAPAPKKKRRWGRIILTLLLVAVLGLAGFGVWLDMSLQRIPVFATADARPAAGNGTTWLLVGSDSRDGLSPEQQAALSTGGEVGNRTDTILLVHIPGLGSSTPPTMVSIPRDSYVEIPDYGTDKINAAYSLGGAPLLAQTVEQATGLRLDHYAEVGFGGFADVVDAAGGVPMCLAEPVDDPLAGINLPAGCQDLDGPSALGYVRSRATPRADLDRMTNQRDFMSALLQRVSSPGVWLNPLRWFALTHSGLAALTVDDDAHVWDLGRLAWAMHGDMITTTVPIGSYDETSSGSVVTWSEAADRLFSALASDSPVPQDVLDAAP